MWMKRYAQGLMYSYPPLKEGCLRSRYKRFFADLETKDGLLTVHNPNTGAMRSLLKEGNPVLYSESDNPKRKLKHTLELINADGEWVVSNTIRVNRIVEAALLSGELGSLYTGGELIREYTYHDSKIDFLLSNEAKRTLVEVKSVTYFDKDTCYFPDAVTTRGRKHLYTLARAVDEGFKAVMLYVCMVKREFFSAAGHIDPAYAEALDEVKKRGVQVLLVHCAYDKVTNSVSVKEL